MKIERKLFGIEPVPVKYARPMETYSCSKFYIWHDPVDSYYEIGVFDERLCHKIRALASRLPDSIKIVDDFFEMDTNTAMYVYGEESLIDIRIKSPAELMVNSDDTELESFRSTGPMVKVFAGTSAMYDVLTRWSLEYPSLVHGNLTPGQPPGFPGDDEFMIPIEMISVAFRIELPIGQLPATEKAIIYEPEDPNVVKDSTSTEKRNVLGVDKVEGPATLGFF